MVIKIYCTVLFFLSYGMVTLLQYKPVQKMWEFYIIWNWKWGCSKVRNHKVLPGPPWRYRIPSTWAIPWHSFQALYQGARLEDEQLRYELESIHNTWVAASQWLYLLLYNVCPKETIKLIKINFFNYIRSWKCYFPFLKSKRDYILLSRVSL